jgi:hypothetical protein
VVPYQYEASPKKKIITFRVGHFRLFGEILSVFGRFDMPLINKRVTLRKKYERSYCNDIILIFANREDNESQINIVYVYINTFEKYFVIVVLSQLGVIFTKDDCDDDVVSPHAL